MTSNYYYYCYYYSLFLLVEKKKVVIKQSPISIFSFPLNLFSHLSAMLAISYGQMRLPTYIIIYYFLLVGSFSFFFPFFFNHLFFFLPCFDLQVLYNLTDLSNKSRLLPGISLTRDPFLYILKDGTEFTPSDFAKYG